MFAFPQLWHGCVGAWCPGEGASGFLLRGATQRRNHGVLTNMDPGTDWIASGNRLCLDFDGADDYVQHGLLPPFNDATACCWVYPGTQVAALPRILDSTYNAGLWIGMSAGQIGGAFKAGGSPYGSFASFPAGQWVHVAVRRVGQINRCFVNGTDVGSSDYTGGAGATTGATVFRIGASNIPNNWFVGKVDDVLIYDRALTRSEIQVLASRRGVAYTRRRRLFG